MGRDPFNAVVQAAADVAVMHHEGVGEAGELSRASSLPMTCGSPERLPEVMTSGVVETVEQKVMERRVGQHPAERRLPGARRSGRGAPVFLQKNDGGGGAL
jgi:hypothetical protein